MAFIENSITFSAGGKFPYSGMDWTGNKAIATLKVETSGNTVEWTITMATSISGGGGVPYVYLYLKIDGQEIINDYYGGESGWSTKFPCKNGSTKSGTVTLKSSNDESIPIVLECCPSLSSGWDDYRVSKTLTRTYYTSVGMGKTEVKDNYNNTFTIKATKGADGENNPAGGPTGLKWGYVAYTDNYTSGTPIKLTISGTDSTRRIIASSTTTATYGSNQIAYAKDSSGTLGVPIKQYVGPNAATQSSLKITYPSNRSRFTLKEDTWSLSWTAPSTNNSCPIKGYRVRLYRKRGTGPWVSLPIFRNDGWYLSTKDLTTSNSVTGATYDIYYDTDSSAVSFSLYPKYYSTSLIEANSDIKPGDKIKFSVIAYTKYGKNFDGTKLFKSGVTEVISNECEVKNAGIVQLKTSSGWKEGQVYVKTSDGWKEAESVNVKTADGWKESQ